MTPSELRELADALAKGTHFVDSPELHAAMQNAADYLRACADEKPVGYATANGLRMLKQDDATVLLYAHDYLIRPDHVALYTHPAPAAPQVLPQSEPPQWTKNEDGSWSTAPFVFPADITIVVNRKVEQQIPQAEPKEK